MIQFFVKYRKPIFIATITVFILGTFVGLGSYLLTDADVSDAIAEVGGGKIPRRRFDIQVRNILDRIRDQGETVDKETEKRIRQDVLRDLIVESLFAREGERVGLVVTDLEVAADIRETFKRDDQFDQRLYFQAVQTQFQMTPGQYEAMRRKQLLAFKFRQLVQRSAKLTPVEVRSAYRLENNGLVDFEKQRAEFTARLQQRRSLELLNYILRQLSATTDIKSYLQPLS